MTSPTLGLNANNRHSLKPSVRNTLLSLRKQGMTCEQIAKATGVGKSTIARYTSDWYQKNAGQANIKRQGRRKGVPNKKKAAKANVAAQKPQKQEGLQPLSQDAIKYINSIYESHRSATGNPIGNLLIRIGKALGGHYPV